jgi:hypothetical protein
LNIGANEILGYRKELVKEQDQVLFHQRWVGEVGGDAHDDE